ncbi:MAG: HAD family hydrolase, partial [Gammaproteobacteria bacterium]|nr:HAD family hydrolase [Gammaproteobacteria bacterium]NIT41151.1 HAD family hydrolase [Gammaproteobacteria bacterium]
FDKTGTITKGKPELTDLVGYGHWNGDGGQDELLRLAGSVEKGSEHPLGRAIVERAEIKGLRLFEPKYFEA